LEKSVVVDVAYDQLRSFPVISAEHGLVQLRDEILLKRFLDWNGIEQELALLVCFLRTAPAIEVGAGRLRHVITPFLIQARQFFEFVLKILVG
jgi:hypothetical protein